MKNTKKNGIGLNKVTSKKLTAISKKNEELERRYEENQTYKLLDKVCDLASHWGCNLNGTKEVN